MVVLFLFLLGLVIGSFLSATAWRVLRGISIAKGRSFCPHCKHQIAWFDNIPVLSYVILRGKCRHCKKPIPIREPIIELSSGVLFVLLLWQWPQVLVTAPWLQPFGLIGLVFGYVLLSLSIAIVITDIEEQIIPDTFVFIAFVASFLVLLLSPAPDIWVRLTCAFAGASFLLFLHLITKGRGMGLGDVKLVLFPGLILGFPLTIIWFFVSFILGAVIGVLLLLLQKATFKAKIPFGPFLIVGFWITLLWGHDLLNYLLPNLFV